MPFPEQHQYMTVIGDCYNSTEKWQFGLRLTDGGVSNQETALAIADDVETWWRSAAPYTSSVDTFEAVNTHRLTELKVARIGTDGLYPSGQTSYSHFYLPPIAGGASPPSGMLAQGTICVTLTTTLPRGLASKGRVYLPPSWLYTTGTDGLIAAAKATQIAKSMQRLINAINANTLVGNVAIYSRGKGVAAFDATHKRVEYTYPNPGASNVVTGVRVGRVIDTQRRRRRSLAETYQVQAL
jgi:hypothetical protein